MGYPNKIDICSKCGMYNHKAVICVECVCSILLSVGTTEEIVRDFYEKVTDFKMPDWVMGEINKKAAKMDLLDNNEIVKEMIKEMGGDEIKKEYVR